MVTPVWPLDKDSREGSVTALVTYIIVLSWGVSVIGNILLENIAG